MMKAFALAALAAFAAATPTATTKLAPRQASTGNLPVITVRGNAFWNGNERFYVKGVAYQPGGESLLADPLLDLEGLARDIENFKTLGINTIRIYSIDNSETHEEGMRMLDEAGIYVALDINTPKFSINRLDNSSMFQSYNDRYLQSVFSTVDLFSGYNNILLYFNGNEVINQVNNTMAAPYIKAVNRDIKAYMSARGHRAVPVGYAAADVSENVDQQLHYFNCGPESVRGDFFALNDYSWCDPSDFRTSGWDQKVQRYSGYSAPIVMAEFGCITNRRDWNEVGTLFSTQMSSVYSGGLAYEYALNANGYGIVSIQNGEVTPNEDFERLAAKFNAQSFPSGDGGFSDSNQPSDCPAQSPTWEVADAQIPQMPPAAQRYFQSGAGAGPGFGANDDSVVTSHYGSDAPGGYSQAFVAAGNGPNGEDTTVQNGGGNGGNGTTGAASSLSVGPMALVGVAAGFALLL